MGRFNMPNYDAAVVVVVVVAFNDARVMGLLATDSCLLGSRVLPPITGAA